MSQDYSISEIVKFAVEIEKEGYIFYKTMSGKTSNEKVKAIFTKLMNDEKKHEEKFTNLIDYLGPDKNNYIFHSENEYISYLHSFIENLIFEKNKGDNILNELKTDSEAIEYAINKEYDSIKFYQNMKELTSKENHSTIDMIISEENLHVSNLLDLKKDI